MKKIIAIAVIVGLVMTLVTGLINTTPDDLVGATWYGWPAAWRIVPVTATPSSNYEIVPFVEDFIFWFVVAFVILIVWRKFKK